MHTIDVPEQYAKYAATTCEPSPMTGLETGLYVRIEELDGGSKPLPLSSGFSLGQAYRVLGLYNPSETSEAYFALSNDRDEVWFICNRHVRTYALFPDLQSFRVPVTGTSRPQMALM